MKVGWLGKALILVALDQIGKALEARRSREADEKAGSEGDRK